MKTSDSFFSILVFFGFRLFDRRVIADQSLDQANRKDRAFLTACGDGNGAKCHDVLQCRRVSSGFLVRHLGYMINLNHKSEQRLLKLIPHRYNVGWQGWECAQFCPGLIRHMKIRSTGSQ
jgi:hypothetical protein